jgi:hypothetical protein
VLTTIMKQYWWWWWWWSFQPFCDCCFSSMLLSYAASIMNVKIKLQVSAVFWIHTTDWGTNSSCTNASYSDGSESKSWPGDPNFPVVFLRQSKQI